MSIKCVETPQLVLECSLPEKERRHISWPSIDTIATMRKGGREGGRGGGEKAHGEVQARQVEMKARGKRGEVTARRPMHVKKKGRVARAMLTVLMVPREQKDKAQLLRQVRENGQWQRW